ncbi:hypothetical protein HMPREF9440_02497 [Sutterella parvirubra YIT 11816]|uniref:Uncharacterized protein n=1 Tax=Sutterella parvirubra YIT 11816 TaxID=762967 RepID=H3KI95_9BURK|nr:hypothetical protein HMPREF9440_02497 [Sutterella parvirubra YIT 11816]
MSVFRREAGRHQLKYLHRHPMGITVSHMGVGLPNRVWYLVAPQGSPGYLV